MPRGDRFLMLCVLVGEIDVADAHFGNAREVAVSGLVETALQQISRTGGGIAGIEYVDRQIYGYPFIGLKSYIGSVVSASDQMLAVQEVSGYICFPRIGGNVIQLYCNALISCFDITVRSYRGVEIQALPSPRTFPAQISTLGIRCGDIIERTGRLCKLIDSRSIRQINECSVLRIGYKFKAFEINSLNVIKTIVIILKDDLHQIARTVQHVIRHIFNGNIDRVPCVAGNTLCLRCLTYFKLLSA